MLFGFKSHHDAFYPQAVGLAVITTYFPPSCLHPPHITAQGWLQVCWSCSFWPILNGFPLKYIQKDDGMIYQKASRSNRKLSVTLDGCNWARTGMAMAYIPESWQGAGVWRTSMSSSPLSESSVCHSLSPSVTPQRAVAAHSPLMHPPILATVALPSLTCSATQKGNMSSFSPHTELKRPH